MVNHALVMVVDDEEDILRLLSRVLELEGHRVLRACDGMSALTLVEEHRPELMVLDIKMPGMSGLEVLQEIRAAYPDIAVIMASAVADTRTAIECMKQGSYDYVVKPFQLAEVVLTVNRALERRVLELENREYQRSLGQVVEEQTSEIQDLRIAAITALAHALEAKDEYTSGHSQRVAALSAAIAEELGLPQQSVERVKLAGSIHDIGKIGVRETVLNKPETLTELEYWHVSSHCEVGEHIVAPVVKDREILQAVRYHHERFDGSGYPDQLSGEGIPLLARILQVADAYDAMTSERPYRRAMSAQAACDEILRSKGTHFDPTVADAFLRMEYAPDSDAGSAEVEARSAAICASGGLPTRLGRVNVDVRDMVRLLATEGAAALDIVDVESIASGRSYNGSSTDSQSGQPRRGSARQPQKDADQVK